MCTEQNLLQFGEPGLLGKWIATKPGIWQMDMFDAGKFAWFANEKAIKNFSEEHIRVLWRTGLLRADLVLSPRKLKLSGLIEIGRDKERRYLYADERQPRQRKRGWGGSAAKLKPLPSGITLYFHPFRYYVLYHINRISKLHISPIQMFWALEHYPKALQIMISSFQRQTAKSEFLNGIKRWNNITSLAIATEPCIYQKLFSSLRYSPSRDLTST